MIELKFNIENSATVAMLKTKASDVIAALVRGMNISMIKLQAYIDSQKLSGQVLKRGPNRPGHSGGELARSIRVILAGVEAGVVQGGVQGAGGTAWYGKLHEYGGSFVAARKILKHPPHLVTRAGGERVMTGSPYGIFFPERSFMRVSLTEMRSAIFDQLTLSVNEGLNK